MLFFAARLWRLTLNLPPPTYVGRKVPDPRPCETASSSCSQSGLALFYSSDFVCYVQVLRTQEAESPAGFG